MTSGRVTGQAFATNASRWPQSGGLPVRRGIQQVRGSRRAAYERLIGHPIVTRDTRRRIVPVGLRRSYVPATLVSGIPPTAASGIDLGGAPGIGRVLARALSSDDVRATPLASLPDGPKGSSS